MIKKIISLSLIFINLFLLISFAAQEKPTITNTSNDPISGYYVVYSYKGQTYRSDESGTAFNSNMWKLLDDSERKKVVSSISYRNDRVSQFGAEGNDMIMDWYKESNEWSKAKKQWEEKISKKHFPVLEEYFSVNNLGLHFPCYDGQPNYIQGANKLLYDNFNEKKAEMNECFNIGKSAYSILGHLKGKQITVAVNFGSYEIIKMLSDTYFMPAATRGAKPISDLLGQVLGAAADQGMSSLASPEAPGSQIATIEKLITDCEQIARTVMQIALPEMASDLCDILEEIEDDRIRVNEEYLEKELQFQQEQTTHANQINLTLLDQQEAGETYIDQKISFEALINMPVPTKYVNEATEDDYLAYCSQIKNEIPAEMATIVLKYADLQSEFEATIEDYDQKNQDILYLLELDTIPQTVADYYVEVYNKDQNRLHHNVVGFENPHYRPMLEVVPSDFIYDFNTDLFTYYGYAESTPYYNIVKERFFNENISDYEELIIDFEAHINKMEILNEIEDDFFVSLGNIYGKSIKLSEKIQELESIYASRVLNYTFYGWEGVYGNSSVQSFFEPLYPPDSDVLHIWFISSALNDYKQKFSYIQFLCNYLKDLVSDYDYNCTSLEESRSNYNEFANNYLTEQTKLAQEYFVVKANYENAISQVYSSINGIRNVTNEYFSTNHCSYYYDGKYYFMPKAGEYPYVNMSLIQTNISNSANPDGKRLSILNDLKGIKTQEQTYMRQFETAKAHQEYYGNEIRHLYNALNLNNTGSRASVAYLTNHEMSSFENIEHIISRLFPASEDRDLINAYNVVNVKGSNVNKAIDMLEGKTENYFKMEYYQDIVKNDNAQNFSLSPHSLLAIIPSDEYENKLRNIYHTTLSIFEGGKNSEITYAQSSIITQYQNLINSLVESEINYTEMPISVINLKNKDCLEKKVTVTIENNSGFDITNKSLIFASYTENNELKEIKYIKITEIQNLYSETKECEFEENVINYKIFLWDKISNLKALSKS